MSTLKIDIPLQPKQEALLDLVENSPATWIGYGGSRGGAKSHGARAVMLIRRLQYPGTRGLIFRRTFEQLWENHIQPLFTQYPFMRAWYNAQHREVTLPNGSVIVFGYAENRGDIDRFQGKEYMDIMADEGTHLREDELVFLNTCKRQTGIADAKCKMVITCNPGNIGHAFIKRVFISKDYRDKEEASNYAFLQARAWDNVEWSRSALAAQKLTVAQYYSWTDEQRFAFFVGFTEYGKLLNSLPASLRIGHLMGDWNQFAGSYFDVFDPAVHVKPAQGLEPWSSRWISIDWGFAHDSAVQWHGTIREGLHTTYREFVQNNLTPKMLAAAIIEQCRGEKIEDVYLSPDAFARKTNNDTVASQLDDEFRKVGLPTCQPADNDRIGGWMLMYSLLQAGQWTIDPSCKRLIEGIQAATRDAPDKLEDVLKTDGDDSIDSARYGIKSRLSLAPTPREVLIERKVTSQDVSLQMLQRRKAELEIRSSGPVPVRRRFAVQRRWGAH